MAKKSVNIYLRLLKYVVPYWWAFLLGVGGSILLSGVDAYTTHFMKPLLDVGFVQRNKIFLERLPIILMTLFLVRGVSGFVARYFMSRVGRDVVRVLRNEMFAHLLRLPAAYYDKATSGQLLTRIIYNVDQVANACTNAVTTAVQSLALIIGLFIVMLMINWRLTILYLAIAPLLIIVIRFTAKRMRRLSGNVQDHLGNITHISEETIEGYKVVKIFGGQQYETHKFGKANQQNRDQALKVITTESLSTAVVMFLGAAVFALIVYLVTTTSHATFGLTAGGFVAMIGAMLALTKPMQSFSSVNNVIQQGLAGAESVFDLLDSAAEHEVRDNALQATAGKLVFDKVGFCYNSQNKDALDDISFTAQAGQMIALVGRSGSGKSTLVSLLPRFYDLQRGTISIDGQDIMKVSLASLRDNVALVTQHITLFNDTIANNIAYGQLEKVSREDIINAAKFANALEFIEQFPQGLETVVGENGVLLSGGQRQRIAIARAILKDCPILILDEATSALDTESERKIQQALDKLMQGRTTLVIAHRLSTIENADNILVLDAGKVIESGSHQSLLKQAGFYAKLYQMQFTNINYDTSES